MAVPTLSAGDFPELSAFFRGTSFHLKRCGVTASPSLSSGKAPKGTLRNALSAVCLRGPASMARGLQLRLYGLISESWWGRGRKRPALRTHPPAYPASRSQSPFWDIPVHKQQRSLAVPEMGSAFLYSDPERPPSLLRAFLSAGFHNP